MYTVLFPSFAKPPGTLTEGVEHVANKAQILQDLLWPSPPNTFSLGQAMREWSALVAALATKVAAALRLALADRIAAAEQLMLAVEDPAPKRIHDIRAFLDSGDPFVPDTTLRAYPKRRSFTAIKLVPDAARIDFFDALEAAFPSMLALEADGILKSTSESTFITGLFCLSLVPDNVGSTLDAHGVDYWICWIINSAVTRNNSTMMTKDKLVLTLAVSADQKNSRAGADDIYADLIRGLHCAIARKCCLIWVKHLAVLTRELNRLIAPGSEAQRHVHTALTYGKKMGIKRHDTSDAAKRWDPASCPPSGEAGAAHGKLHEFCALLTPKGVEKTLALAVLTDELRTRAQKGRKLAYAELVEAEYLIAVFEAHRTMREQAEAHFKRLNPDWKTKVGILCSTAMRWTRAGEEGDDDCIYVWDSAFTMHASPTAKEKYMTDADTPLPPGANRKLLMDPGAIRNPLFISWETAFGSNGRGGIYGSDSAYEAAVATRTRLLPVMETFAVLLRAPLESLVQVPSFLAAKGTVAQQSALAMNHVARLMRLDAAVKQVVETMSDFIAAAWGESLKRGQNLPQTVGLPHRHSVHQHAFALEVLAHADFVKDGFGVIVVFDDDTGHPILQEPSVWASSFWTTFTALASNAVKWFDSIRSKCTYNTILAAAGGSVVRLSDKGPDIDPIRKSAAAPEIEKQLDSAARLYGGAPPQTFIEVLGLQTEHTPVLVVIEAWLAWTTTASAKELLPGLKDKDYPRLPKHRAAADEETITSSHYAALAATSQLEILPYSQTRKRPVEALSAPCDDDGDVDESD